jgi:hypothetical protein
LGGERKGEDEKEEMVEKVEDGGDESKVEGDVVVVGDLMVLVWLANELACLKEW